MFYLYLYTITLLVIEIFIFTMLDLTNKLQIYKIQQNNVNIYLYFDSFVSLLFNIFIIIPLVGIPTSYIYFYFNIINLQYSLFEGLFKLFLVVILEDQIFYWIHRLFHYSIFYYIHKTHHRLHIPISIGIFYSHWLENILLNFLPVILCPVVIGLNYYWLQIWFFISITSGVISHSNYKIPFSLYHNNHHKYQKGNYGVLGLSDLMYGTYIK